MLGKSGKTLPVTPQGSEIKHHKKAFSHLKSGELRKLDNI